VNCFTSLGQDLFNPNGMTVVAGGDVAE